MYLLAWIVIGAAVGWRFFECHLKPPCSRDYMPNAVERAIVLFGILRRQQ